MVPMTGGRNNKQLNPKIKFKYIYLVCAISTKNICMGRSHIISPQAQKRIDIAKFLLPQASVMYFEIFTVLYAL
jgi:hypothetical protein